LDYAHCIETHGPIDCMDGGDVRLADCVECGDTFSRAVRSCPNCGWTIPKQEIERAEAAEREKRMHEREAAQRAILGSEPEEVRVDAVRMHRHRKPGKPDSIRVEYRCGISTVREWVCLEHGGFAEKKARQWWASRFGRDDAKTITVDKALSNLFAAQLVNAVTDTITVVRRGKHPEIVGYGLTTDKRSQYVTA